MNKVGIIPNTERDEKLEYTIEIINYLKEKKCLPCISHQVAQQLNMATFEMDMQDIYENCDFLIVLGGDGTILRVAKNAALHSTPLLGINLGNIGYLTDVEKTDAALAIDKTLSGEFKIEKRIMLEAVTTSKSTGNETLLALNEICINKGLFTSMISFELFINEEYIDDYRADGLIISTPTGSTAYNLSAGGPILKPDMDAIAITPVCPHMIYSRPSVVSAEDTIKIKILGTPNIDGLLILDGQGYSHLAKDDVITIRRSKYFTSVIKTNNLSFYEILRKKIK